MKVLIIGSGGREHAIAWKLSKSPKVTKLYCAPGNAGIGQIAECVPISAMEFDKLADFAQENGIDLTVVGMDDPLVDTEIFGFSRSGIENVTSLVNGKSHKNIEFGTHGQRLVIEILGTDRNRL